MVTRIIITLDDDVVKLLNDKAEEVSLSRNQLVSQICRKHFGLPNVFEKAEVSKYKFVTVPYCPACDVPLTPGFSGDYTVQGYTCPECGSSFPLWGPFKEAEP